MKTPPVTLNQLWGGTFGILLVTAFYSFPRAIAKATSTAAPWAILLAGIVAMLLLLPTVATLAGQDGKNVTDLALAAGGRPLAIGLALIYCAGLVGTVGLSLRQASELVVTALYPHTPQTFAMTSLLLVSCVGAAISPAGAIWLASLFAGPTLISLVLLLLGNVGWGQFRNAMPPTGHGLLPTLAEVIPMASYFSPLFHFVVFSQLLPTPRRLVRGAALAVAAASITWCLVILMYLMVFPLPAGLGTPFPIFEMSRLVQGGRFLERVDAIWIVVWAFGSALRTALALMAAARLLAEAFRLPDHRGAILPLGIATLAVALFPANQAGAVEAEYQLVRQADYMIFFLLPLLVTLVYRFRTRQGRGELRG